MERPLNQSTDSQPWTAVVLTEPRNRIISILDSSIFYGVIVLIAFTAIPYGTVDPWSQALFEGAVFLLTLLWIIHGFLLGSWEIGNVRLVAPLIALVLFAVLQSVTWWKTELAGEQVWFALSADPFETWAFVLRMAALVLVALLVIRFTSTTKRLGILVHAIVAVAIGTAVFGIARQAMQHGEGFVLSRLEPDGGFAQFINKNHFPFLIEMAFGLVVGVAFMQKGRRERVLLYVSALLLMGATVVLSRSRGGLLTITVQAVFAALLFVNSKTLGREKGASQTGWIRWSRSIAVTAVTIVALLVIIVTGVAWLGGDQLTTGVETAAGEMLVLDRSEINEAARRRDIWRASWSMFKAHPVAGAGFGGYWAEFPRYHSASGVLTPQQAHNDYLEVLASGGVIGAALLVWFAVAVIRQVRQNVFTADGFQRAVLLGTIISLVGAGVHSIVDFGLHITVNALVFMVLLGIISLRTVRGESAGKGRQRLVTGQ